MTHLKTEGIIVSSIDFQEKDQILTVFSKDFGIIKLIVKGAKNPKKQTLTPLIQAEFVFKKGKNEISKCQEISFLNLFLPLRSDLNCLESSCRMIQSIYRSQMVEKPAPVLYQLLLSYLKKTSQLANPNVLADSLQMKILRHDGLFSLTNRCALCEAELLAHTRWGNETFCLQHSPAGGLFLEEEEMQTLILLAYSQSYEELSALAISDSLRYKIQFLFDNHR